MGNSTGNADKNDKTKEMLEHVKTKRERQREKNNNKIEEINHKVLVKEGSLKR